MDLQFCHLVSLMILEYFKIAKLFPHPFISLFFHNREERRKGRKAQTESQNHRMVRVGRHLCGSSSPTPLPKQGHLQQAVEDLVQAGN